MEGKKRKESVMTKRERRKESLMTKRERRKESLMTKRERRKESLMTERERRKESLMTERERRRGEGAERVLKRTQRRMRTPLHQAVVNSAVENGNRLQDDDDDDDDGGDDDDGDDDDDGGGDNADDDDNNDDDDSDDENEDEDEDEDERDENEEDEYEEDDEEEDDEEEDDEEEDDEEEDDEEEEDALYYSFMGPPRLMEKYPRVVRAYAGASVELTCPLRHSVIGGEKKRKGIGGGGVGMETVKEGEEEEGKLEVVLIEWEKDGRFIGLGWSRFRLKRDRLRIKRTRVSDSGNYTCTATNGLGFVTGSYLLCVYNARGGWWVRGWMDGWVDEKGG